MASANTRRPLDPSWFEAIHTEPGDLDDWDVASLLRCKRCASTITPHAASPTLADLNAAATAHHCLNPQETS